MARHHDDPDAAFHGWCDVWLDPAFRAWSLEADAALLDCPVLLIQGADDEYATLEQLDRIEAARARTGGAAGRARRAQPAPGAARGGASRREACTWNRWPVSGRRIWETSQPQWAW